MEKLVKELFEARVKSKGEFYGIKVNKISGYSNVNEASLESFDAYYNPLDEKRKNMKILVLSILLGSLFIIQMFLTIAVKDMKDLNSMFIARNIIYGIMILLCFSITLLLKKQLDFVVKILFNLFPLVCLFSLYNFEKRMDFLVLFLSIAICLLIAFIYIILFIFKKEKEWLLNGIMLIFYPLLVSLIKVFTLNEYLFFNDNSLGIFIIVGLCVSFIILCIAISKIKDRSNKKEYAGKLCAAFFVPIVLVSILPYLYFQSINYAFDGSIGIEHTYYITNKQIRYGGRGSRNYYLFLSIDVKEEKISVSRYVYEEYEEGQYITLEEHEGYFNIKYYEYVVEE